MKKGIKRNTIMNKNSILKSKFILPLAEVGYAYW